MFKWIEAFKEERVFKVKLCLIYLGVRYRMLNKRIISLISFLLIVMVAGTILAACGSGSTATPVSTSKSVGNNATLDGQAIMQERCSVCHSINRVTSAHHTAAQWQNTVNRMINHGAKLAPQEKQVLIDYLAQNFK